MSERKSRKGVPNPLNKKHGLSSHPLYWIWAGVKKRCYNKNDMAYAAYGGRGVEMCDEWKNDPKTFVEWGLKNGWKSGLEIDKDIIAKSLGLPALIYSPDRCQFVTGKENSNSRRNNRIIEFNGKSQTLHQWSEELGIKHTTISMRLNKYGYTVERALTEGLLEGRKRRVGLVYKKRDKINT